MFLRLSVLEGFATTPWWYTVIVIISDNNYVNRVLRLKINYIFYLFTSVFFSNY